MGLPHRMDAPGNAGSPELPLMEQAFERSDSLSDTLPRGMSTGTWRGGEGRSMELGPPERKRAGGKGGGMEVTMNRDMDARGRKDQTHRWLKGRAGWEMGLAGSRMVVLLSLGWRAGQ